MRGLFGLVAIAIVIGCSTPRRGVPAAGSGGDFDRVAATKAVYEAVLRHEGGPRILRFVVDPAQFPLGASLDRVTPGDRLRADTAADFRRGRPGRMPRDPAPGLPVHWFTSAEWEALPTESGAAYELDAKWYAFHQRFPDSAGHMAFSHVGFSRDGRQALVHMWSGSASLSGAGHFYLLEARAGAWSVVDQVMTVIA